MDNENSLEGLNKDAWRVFRIISEFVDGFETMTTIGPSVSIFGSSRLNPDSDYYAMGVAIGKELAKRGLSVITGGGPGLMEAANQGAQPEVGHSCGLCISLPTEVHCNPYIDKKFFLNFRYFFVRKVMFIRYAQGFVFLPGGYGTCDELFEALTLIQTEKTTPFPIYLMGTEYWKGLIDWIQETMLGMGCISEKDFQMIRITDDPVEVADGIEHHYKQQHVLKNF